MNGGVTPKHHYWHKWLVTCGECREKNVAILDVLFNSEGGIRVDVECKKEGCHAKTGWTVGFATLIRLAYDSDLEVEYSATIQGITENSDDSAGQ